MIHRYFALTPPGDEIPPGCTRIWWADEDGTVTTDTECAEAWAALDYERPLTTLECEQYDLEPARWGDWQCE